MPTLRNAIVHTWTATWAVLRFVARFGIGLLGAYWLVGGIVGAVVSPFMGAWTGAPVGLLTAFIGWVVAYGAFKRWPWETYPLPDPQPNER